MVVRLVTVAVVVIVIKLVVDVKVVILDVVVVAVTALALAVVATIVDVASAVAVAALSKVDFHPFSLSCLLHFKVQNNFTSNCVFIVTWIRLLHFTILQYQNVNLNKVTTKVKRKFYQ